MTLLLPRQHQMLVVVVVLGFFKRLYWTFYEAVNFNRTVFSRAKDFSPLRANINLVVYIITT